MDPNIGNISLLVAVIGALALFSFLAGAVWSGLCRRQEAAYYKSETPMKTVAPGAPATSGQDLFREQEEGSIRHRRESQTLAGVILIAVGIALMALLRTLEHDATIGVPAGVFLVGLLPLLVGVVLADGWISFDHEKSEKNATEISSEQSHEL